MGALTIYYDGLCPLCQAEILFLMSRNHQRLLNFVDLQAPAFDASLHQVSCAQAMAKIHGRLANGELLTGIPVFAEAYRRIGLTVMAWLISRTWVRLFLDPVYLIFAKHRHAISRTLGPGLLRLARRRYLRAPRLPLPGLPR